MLEADRNYLCSYIPIIKMRDFCESSENSVASSPITVNKIGVLNTSDDWNNSLHVTTVPLFSAYYLMVFDLWVCLSKLFGEQAKWADTQTIDPLRCLRYCKSTLTCETYNLQLCMV